MTTKSKTGAGVATLPKSGSDPGFAAATLPGRKSGSDPDSGVDALAAAFVARTLPKPQWTHHAHLRVGLWHLLRHSPEEALPLLRARIRALNESHGVANSETGGYHESITRFYVWQIAIFLDRAGRERPIDELAGELIDMHGDKDLPLRYWSKDLLMSREARHGWVAPDLVDLQTK